MKTLLESNIKIRLVELMESNNVESIQQFHDETGLSRTTISELLNGKKKLIRLDTIYRLCKYFDCEIGDLIEFKDRPNVGA